MKSKSASGGLVYSTDSGRMCPQCRQPLAQCQCSKTPARPADDGRTPESEKRPKRPEDTDPAPGEDQR